MTHRHRVLKAFGSNLRSERELIVGSSHRRGWLKKLIWIRATSAVSNEGFAIRASLVSCELRTRWARLFPTSLRELKGRIDEVTEPKLHVRFFSSTVGKFLATDSSQILGE